MGTQAGAESTGTVVNKPNSDRRAVSSPVNGARGGRPRGAGRKPVDWSKVSRLRMSGASYEAIAHAVGLSRWTLRQRMAEHRSEEEAI